MVKNSPANARDSEDAGLIPGLGRPQEEETATPYSKILAWKIPWTEETGRPYSTGVIKSGTQLSTRTHTHTHLQVKISINPISEGENRHT